MRRGLCALVLGALVFTSSAVADSPPHAQGSAAARSPAASQPTFEAPRLTSRGATALFLAVPKVEHWLARYPPRPRTEAEFDHFSRRWTVHVWSGRAGEIARGVVVDLTGQVVEAWTGPQVAWTMARGYHAAFAGKAFSDWWVWGIASVLFFLGVADPRRLLSLRTLDVLALLSFTVSLAFFDRGEIFPSSGRRPRCSRGRCSCSAFGSGSTSRDAAW
jgi:hypothetical protein